MTRTLTVTEAAIIDAEQQKAAYDVKAKAFDPTRQAYERGDFKAPADLMDVLCQALRIELTFDHPVDTRQQLEVLASAIVEAQVVTQQHELGINRQRMRLRHIMQTAAETLCFMQGKTPSRLYHRVGRRKRRVKENTSS